MERLYIYLHEWLMFKVNVGKWYHTWILWDRWCCPLESYKICQFEIAKLGMLTAQVATKVLGHKKVPLSSEGSIQSLYIYFFYHKNQPFMQVKLTFPWILWVSPWRYINLHPILWPVQGRKFRYVCYSVQIQPFHSLLIYTNQAHLSPLLLNFARWWEQPKTGAMSWWLSQSYSD